ncbi:MAG: BatD family protein [candidate division KSB1 bacterium]|nr:BatD family protein [candidate division KSB1 bacterium]
MKRILWIFNSLLFLAAAAMIQAEPLTVTTTVSRNPASLNEQVIFTIELSGDGATKVDRPELPDMGGYLTFLGSGGTSQNITFINGRMSASKSYSFYYLATKVGSFTIPPVKVVYDNQTYESKPINMTIVQGAAPQAAPPSTSAADRAPAAAGEDLYLRTIVSKKRVYQNEPVFVTFRIYAAVSVGGYSIVSPPETSGFWVEEIEAPQQPQVNEEVINGKRYVYADIKKIAVFPTSAGEKTIGPMTLQCEVRVQGRRSRDPFDMFFNDPFFSRTVTQTIASPAVTIDVMPLPEAGKPAEFTGAVGKYQLKAELDRTEITTDDALTLKVTVSGSGNIRMISEPKVQIPPEFQSYAPNVSENISRRPGAVSGSKTFEYVLVPRFVGTQRIPPVVFAYFNPESGSYQRLTTPELTVHVAKGQRAVLAGGSGLTREEVKYIGQDIRYIKAEPGKWRRIGVKPYRTTGFFLSLILPVLAFGMAFLYRRNQEKLSSNIALARSRRANAAAMRRLSKAKSFLAVEQQKKFFAEIAEALNNFAADKLNLEKADLISTDLEQAFRSRGVDEALIRDFFALLQTCDYQRFAPSTATLEDMERIYQSAKEVLIKLEKVL